MKINLRIITTSFLFSILITAVLILGFTYNYNLAISNFIIASSIGLFLFLILIFYLIANLDSHDNYKFTKKEQFVILSILLIITPLIIFILELIFVDLKAFEKKIFPFFYASLIIFYLFFVICLYFKEKLQLK